MKKTIVKGSVVGLILCSVVGIALWTISEKEIDFSNEKSWEFYRGEGDNVSDVKGGGVILAGGDGYKAILRKKEYDDFSMEAQVQISKEENENENLNSEAGILFRVQNPEDGLDGYDGYYFGIDVEQQQIIIGKANGDGEGWTEIATKKRYLAYDTPYKLSVKVYGDHIQGFINETENSYPVVDIVDDEFSNGQIGVRNRHAHAAFDQFNISSYKEQATNNVTYTNALLPEAADPDILFVDGTYYLYPTTAGRNVGGIKVYTSTDMVNWTDKGLALLMGEENWGTNGFWAPDLIERDGKYYMYYTANEHLCVAVADSPLGPFEQIEFGPIHEDINEIDAHVFKDEDDQYYLYMVRFDEGNAIWGAKLNDDMITIDEQSLTEILVPSQPWELDMARINEGPYMLKKEGIYYLTYSGSHFESPMYGAGYATSDSPLGPFKKYEHNPIMQSNLLVPGAGHHAVAMSPDQKEMFMIYHRHESIWNTDPREFAIDRMRFTKNDIGETILEVHGPTVTPQPIPSGAKDVENFIRFAPEDLQDVRVKKELAPEKWPLPSEIGIVTSKGLPDNTQKVSVTWDIEESQLSEQTIIKGKISLPDNIENLGDVSLVPEIVVSFN